MATIKDKKAARLTLGMRCGDCLHFKGPKSPLYKDKCSELGTKHYATACQGFTPNFSVMNRGGGNLQNSAKIAALVSEMPASTARILGYMLCKQSSAFEKVGVRFGQPMYLFLEPTVGLARTALQAVQKDDMHYLENYYRTYAIGVQYLGDGLHELYLASSIEGKPDYYVTVNVKDKQKQARALTKQQFRPIRDQLIEEGKRKMPKALRKKLEKLHQETIAARKYAEELDSIRTIDSIPSSWWDNPHTAGRSNAGLKLHKRKKGDPNFDFDSIDDEGAKKPKKKVKKLTLQKGVAKSINIKLLSDESKKKKKKPTRSRNI